MDQAERRDADASTADEDHSKVDEWHSVPLALIAASENSVCGDDCSQDANTYI